MQTLTEVRSDWRRERRMGLWWDVVRFHLHLPRTSPKWLTVVRFLFFLCPFVVKADVSLNRKVLSELGVHEPKTFAALVDFAKQRRAEASTGLKLLAKR